MISEETRCSTNYPFGTGRCLRCMKPSNQYSMQNIRTKRGIWVELIFDSRLRYFGPKSDWRFSGFILNLLRFYSDFIETWKIIRQISRFTWVQCKSSWSSWNWHRILGTILIFEIEYLIYANFGLLSTLFISIQL